LKTAKYLVIGPALRITLSALLPTLKGSVFGPAHQYPSKCLLKPWQENVRRAQWVAMFSCQAPNARNTSGAPRPPNTGKTRLAFTRCRLGFG
jgi:hypothetical protein